MKITIPISIGELFDRISILEIKSLFTDDEYVEKELCELKKIKNYLTFYSADYEKELREVNEKLWKVENKLRKKEKNKEFDEEFIDLARSVYITNDRRSEIKKKINELHNSDYREVKIFDKYL
jgi:predicted  nucleic acid-binding Zn-ribbon protein